jgi:hypothetical protein
VESQLPYPTVDDQQQQVYNALDDDKEVLHVDSICQIDMDRIWSTF